MSSFLTNPNNNTSKIPLTLPYREAYFKCFLFFLKAKFMGKLDLNDKSCQKPKAGNCPFTAHLLKGTWVIPFSHGNSQRTPVGDGS